MKDEILVITSRKRFDSETEFLEQIRRIAEAHPYGIVLREKDLPEWEYEKLAQAVQEICEPVGTRLMIHKYYKVAEKLGIQAIHMPLPMLEEMPQSEREQFPILGASCHSIEEIDRAKACGCTYVTAGHVFPTDCKPGLPPRGCGFLSEAAGHAAGGEYAMPVFALGGMTPARAPEVRRAGASGFAMMSLAMDAKDPEALFASFRESR